MFGRQTAVTNCTNNARPTIIMGDLKPEAGSLVDFYAHCKFFILFTFMVYNVHLGPVVQKPISTNPGLNI